MKKKFRVYHKGGKIVGALGNEDTTTEIPNTDGFILLEMDESDSLGMYAIVAGRVVKRSRLKLTAPETLKAGDKCSLVVELVDPHDQVCKEEDQQVEVNFVVSRGKVSKLSASTVEGKVSVEYTSVDETIPVTINVWSEDAAPTGVDIQLEP